jgi:HPt (histidine-containing phosphotransfer) domain-containing protein
MTQALIDWPQCCQLAGSEALARQLIQLLDKNLADFSQRLKQAYQEKDLTVLRGILHQLRGACCYCAAQRLDQVATEIHLAIGHTNRLPCEAEFQRLNNELAQTQQATQQLLSDAKRQP